MPRDLPRHAFCAGPGVARSHKNFDGLLGLLVRSWFANKGFTIAGALAIIIPVLIAVPCFGMAPFVVVVVALLQEFKDWYYHERLLCIDDSDNCLIGSVLHEPSVSEDGDRKLDLLLAPYTQRECHELLCTHIETNKGLLVNPTSFDDPPFFAGVVPADPPDCDPDIFDDPNKGPDDRRNQRDAIAAYLRRIQGEDPQDKDASANMYNNLLIGWMDRLLDDMNVDLAGQPKNFQGRFYRRDPRFIPPGSALANAIPPDHDPATAWQTVDGSLSPSTRNNPYETQHQPRGLNPMFRFDATRLLPYVHCELDGSALGLMLDRISLAVVSFGIAYTFLCLVLPGFLGWLAGTILAALFAWLIYKLQEWLDGGEDAGQATEPDVDYDDPDHFGEDGIQGNDDLVALYGPWIMDTEHAQYFEIHPVKAYYVLGRNGADLGEYDSRTERAEAGAVGMTNPDLDATLRDVMCRMIEDAETGSTGPVIERRAPNVLSHGLTTRWGGGGVVG